MLMALMQKVNKMQEQMDNVRSEKMRILKKESKEMLGIKNTVIEMKNVFELIVD